MKFHLGNIGGTAAFAALCVTAMTHPAVTAVQVQSAPRLSDGGAGLPRLLQFLPAPPAYTLGTPNCTFDFTDLTEKEDIECIQDYEAPEDAILDGNLIRGNCTDMSTGPPEDIEWTTEKIDTTKVVTKIQFNAKFEGVTKLCLLTRVVTRDDIEMYYVKTPIEVTLEYDGSFSITAGVEATDIEDKAEDKVLFTANAFICNPDFTIFAGTFTISSILYVCVQPNEKQLTTVIQDVNYFYLHQAGDKLTKFDAVRPGGITSAVTIVVSKNTRRLIIGTRLPATFFDTDALIEGVGEVILSQGARKLESGRGLQEDVTQAFNFRLRTEKKPPLRGGSMRSGVLTSNTLSLAVSILATLHCLE